jgi:hypothetical protein
MISLQIELYNYMQRGNDILYIITWSLFYSIRNPIQV